MTALLVALGGAIGAVLRFVVDGEVKHRRPASWPLATFIINVTGSFALGALHAAGISANLMTFGAVGVCGGFTTFSTASVEALSLLRERRPLAALTYASAGVIVCVIAVLTGQFATTI